MSKLGSNAPLTERFKYDPCSVPKEELLDALQKLEEYQSISKKYRFDTITELNNFIYEMVTNSYIPS